MPDIDKFLGFWPNVVKALQQKCRDSRRENGETTQTGQARNENELDDEDYVQDDEDATQQPRTSRQSADEDKDEDDLVFE